MAFRRRFSGRSRFSSFRGRRPRVSWSAKASAPRKWEVGNFFIVDSLVGAEGTYITTITSVAQIYEHLADSTNAAGRLQNNMLRALDIGGMVFQWKVFLNQRPLEGLSNHPIAFGVLQTQRLTTGGSPTGLFNWSQNTTPTIAAGAVTADTDIEMPDRIHWRDMRVIAAGENDFNASQQIDNAGPRSLRLKLRLDDDHGLFFQYGLLNNAGTSVNVTSVFAGTLYYRARY